MKRPSTGDTERAYRESMGEEALNRQKNAAEQRRLAKPCASCGAVPGGTLGPHHSYDCRKRRAE